MIGVIADDLTGAAEIGAVGLRHGLRAELVLAGPNVPVTGQTNGASGDLICVDTDSRLSSPEEAARRAGAAAKWLQAAGARWIYKKVDSVLRGQITAEIEGVMAGTGCELAILVPANPDLGRTIADGLYYIRGIPVNETDFAYDAAYPRTSAFVLEMITPAQQQSVRVSNPSDALPLNGVVIGEAQSRADLDAWAQAGGGRILRAGGAEFFTALLRADGCQAKPMSPLRATRRKPVRQLFVCGSNAASTRDFHAAQQAAGVMLLSLPARAAESGELSAAECEELVQRAVLAYESHTRVVLRVGLERVSEPARAARLATCVVQVAQGILGRVAVDQVFAEGGATAVELARTLGWGRMTVMREWSPGVASMRLKGRQPSEFTIKPGSYAWPPEVAACTGIAHETEVS